MNQETLGTLLCHIVGIPQNDAEGDFVCLASSFNYFVERQAQFGRYVSSNLYSIYGEHLGRRSVAYTGSKYVPSPYLGRDIQECFVYKGGLKHLEAVGSNVSNFLPHWYKIISGADILMVKGEPRINQLHWILQGEIDRNQFTFGEIQLEFAQSNLSWSANISASIENTRVREILEHRQYADIYAAPEERTISSGLFIPFQRQEDMKNGYLYTRKQISSQRWICEYFSNSDLRLNLADNLISKSYLCDDGYYLPKKDKNGALLMMPEFDKQFTSTIGTVTAIRS